MRKSATSSSVALSDLLVEEFMLTSKDRLKEVREKTLGDEVIRTGRKYLEFPNSCLVKGLVKIGRRNIFI